MVRPSEVEIRHDNRCAARHARCYGRGHQILNLEHYLDVLEKEARRDGGFHTLASNGRRRAAWPECRSRGLLEQRLGKSAGSPEMDHAGAGRPANVFLPMDRRIEIIAGLKRCYWFNVLGAATESDLPSKTLWFWKACRKDFGALLVRPLPVRLRRGILEGHAGL